MRSCSSHGTGGDAAEIANTANAAMLAGIVAAICFAMLRVDGAELFASATWRPSKTAAGRS